MNEKLQKELLEFIRDKNNEKGSTYLRIKEDINDHFILKRRYSYNEIMTNIRLLSDSKKIILNFPEGNFALQGGIRITTKGYREFLPWYKKAWIFFTNDLAKILSIISIILSIILAIKDFTEHYASNANLG